MVSPAPAHAEQDLRAAPDGRGPANPPGAKCLVECEASDPAALAARTGEDFP